MAAYLANLLATMFSESPRPLSVSHQVCTLLLLQAGLELETQLLFNFRNEFSLAGGLVLILTRHFPCFVLIWWTKFLGDAAELLLGVCEM